MPVFTSGPNGNIYNCRATDHWKKDELTVLCADLGLSSQRTNKDQRTRILNYLDDPKNSGTLPENPQFQGLYVYRSGMHETSQDKNGGKNSAGKDSEDAEAARTKVLPTGARKKLLDAQLTTDPPAQFTPLGAGTKTAASITQDPDDSEHSSTEDTPQPEPKTPQKHVVRLADLVCITKSDIEVALIIKETGKYAEPRSRTVMLHVTSELPLYTRKAKDGKTEYMARFSDMIPVAVETGSPLKSEASRGGKVFCPGFNNLDEGRMKLGTVHDILKQGDKLQTLSFQRVNFCLLTIREDDLLECVVEWEPEAPDASNVMPAFAKATDVDALTEAAARGAATSTSNTAGALTVTTKTTINGSQDPTETSTRSYECFLLSLMRWRLR
ncbi:hypothetical protein BDP27DRAFT_1429389 [Rhodocollybia butyracea]|uniref:Uncharacterized protein n=1 Tax=Rhodocollybia butyracea TaxID=206335 RepID=A0A9P5P8S3_9AGAR|nr:hypothetical protein BDP27DRAFT_1429389 [Rhodocollybia butyracea]